MRVKDRLVAGLCIMVLAAPFYIAKHINDEPDKANMSYIQMEEKVTAPEDKVISVYISPTGECYHFKKACAGKNAIETTLDKNEKRACMKCVH